MTSTKAEKHLSKSKSSREEEREMTPISRHPKVKSLSESLHNISIMSDEISYNLRRVLSREETNIQRPSTKRDRVRSFQKIRTSLEKLKICASSLEYTLETDVTDVPQTERLKRKRSYTKARSLSKDSSQNYKTNKEECVITSNTENTKKPSKKRKHIREPSSPSSVTCSSSPERSISAEIKERNCESAKRRKVTNRCKDLNKTFSGFTNYDRNDTPSSSRGAVVKRPPSEEKINNTNNRKKRCFVDESCLAKELSLLSVSEMSKENIAPVSIQSRTPPGGKIYKDVIIRNIQSPKLAVKEISRVLMLESDDQLLDKHWKREPLTELTPRQHLLRIQQQMKAIDNLSQSSKKD